MHYTFPSAPQAVGVARNKNTGPRRSRQQYRGAIRHNDQTYRRHMHPIHPVILCGGSGTRLWPVSRKAYPKQFVPLVGAESLYQMTLRRFAAEDYAAPLVMTSDAFRFMATDQAAELGLSDARVVVEPMGRDTAPAILSAALMLEETPDALMLVAPSDHIIANLEAFHAAVRKGAEAARTGAFVTFGVT